MAKYTRVSQIDPENHPLFNRLWTTEGFERLTSESVVKIPGQPPVSRSRFSVMIPTIRKKRSTFS